MNKNEGYQMFCVFEQKKVVINTSDFSCKGCEEDGVIGIILRNPSQTVIFECEKKTIENTTL